MDNETTAVMKEPLDAVFAAPCHVAILRALYRGPGPASGRQIARSADVNHQACSEGLRRLEKLGLVRREVLGRAHAFTMNTGHPVVDLLLVPMFRKEDHITGGKIEALVLEDAYSEEADTSLVSN